MESTTCGTAVDLIYYLNASRYTDTGSTCHSNALYLQKRTTKQTRKNVESGKVVARMPFVVAVVVLYDRA